MKFDSSPIGNLTEGNEPVVMRPNTGNRRSGQAATLDEIAADPALAAGLPPEIVAAHLGRCLIVLGALAGHVLSEAVRRHHPEPSGRGETLLTVRQAAEKLGVSADRLYRHADDFPFVVRVGRSVRFSARGIDRYIQSRCGP